MIICIIKKHNHIIIFYVKFLDGPGEIYVKSMWNHKIKELSRFLERALFIYNEQYF